MHSTRVTVNVNLVTLENELRQRLQEPFYPWGRKQNDKWDDATQFIYDTPTWDLLKHRTQNFNQDLYRYAVNRWFNFWSAVGVEAIFCDLPGVIPAKNPKDRLVDFTIQGIRFDHKTTVFPAGFRYGPYFAYEHPGHLIEWLYQNQSTGRRYHYSNRLFVVLHDGDGQHWKLRAELSLIKAAVQSYVAEFELDSLIKVRANGNVALSDLIWVTNARFAKGAHSEI